MAGWTGRSLTDRTEREEHGSTKGSPEAHEAEAETKDRTEVVADEKCGTQGEADGARSEADGGNRALTPPAVRDPSTHAPSTRCSCTPVGVGSERTSTYLDGERLPVQVHGETIGPFLGDRNISQRHDDVIHGHFDLDVVGFAGNGPLALRRQDDHADFELLSLRATQPPAVRPSPLRRSLARPRSRAGSAVSATSR